MDKYDWDVFISYASEDKASIVAPLASALDAAGLRVWYDEHALTLGDSLQRKIDNGLSKSRYGAVVLSPFFFAKDWPSRELDGMAALEVDGRKVILPIWHNIDADSVRTFSPMLAGRVGVSTRRGLETVVSEILAVVQSQKSRAPYRFIKPGFTAVHVAALNGHATTLRQLIAKGGNVDAVGDDGTTPLMCAAKNGHANTIRILLKAGADPSLSNDRGETALSLATAGCYSAAAVALLPVDRVKKGGQLLEDAVISNNIDVVRKLLEAGADPNEMTHGRRPLLLLACETDNTEIVDLLIEYGADVNAPAPQGKPIIYLMGFRRPWMAKHLEAHLDPDSLLIYGLHEGDAVRAQAAISRGANLETTGPGILGSAMHRAIINHEDKPELMILLLRAAVASNSPELVNRLCKAAYVEAVNYGYCHHLESLLASGFPPDNSVFEYIDEWLARLRKPQEPGSNDSHDKQFEETLARKTLKQTLACRKILSRYHTTAESLSAHSTNRTPG